jgi:hypothetical protein
MMTIVITVMIEKHAEDYLNVFPVSWSIRSFKPIVMFSFLVRRIVFLLNCSVAAYFHWNASSVLVELS